MRCFLAASKFYRRCTPKNVVISHFNSEYWQAKENQQKLAVKASLMEIGQLTLEMVELKVKEESAQKIPQVILKFQKTAGDKIPMWENRRKKKEEPLREMSTGEYFKYLHFHPTLLLQNSLNQARRTLEINKIKAVLDDAIASRNEDAHEELTMNKRQHILQATIALASTLQKITPTTPGQSRAVWKCRKFVLNWTDFLKKMEQEKKVYCIYNHKAKLDRPFLEMSNLIMIIN